jgi:glycosyltransferase involved in cell wall biosynthesis
MNILYLCDEYPPCQHGGIGSVTQQLAREMVKKNHKVSVCGFYPYYRKADFYEEDQGVRVYRRFYGNKLILKLSKHKFLGRIVNIENAFNNYLEFLNALIDKNKIEIIEIPDFNEAFYYTGPRFINFPDFKIPSVIKLHGSYSYFEQIKKKGSYIDFIYKKELFLIHSGTRVLSISEFSKNVAIDLFKYSKNISVIYNGVLPDNFYGDNENSSNTVVFAGTLAEKKGILSLILAWREVISKIPTARLIVCGKGGKSTLMKVNENLSDETRKTIDFKGFIEKDKLSQIYRNASCAIFPSYAESFSMAPLESMRVGCPTIYTERASGGELITNGVDGLLIDPDDLEGIADAILFMLNNPTKAKQMGRNGVKTIRDKFNISSVADEHLKLYYNLIKEGK